jgi:hypothetical protein
MQVRLREYQIFAQRQTTDRVVCNISLTAEQPDDKQSWTLNLAFFDQGSDPPNLGTEASPDLVFVTLPVRDLKNIQHLLETEKVVEAAWTADPTGQLLWFRVNGPQEGVGPG